MSRPSKSQPPNLNLTRPLASKNPPTLRLHPVHSPSDIPTLANINDRALTRDPDFVRWMELFTERDDHETTVRALGEALGDSEYRVVKAVVEGDGGGDGDGGEEEGEGQEKGKGEKIVGFVQWFCGWIVLEKVDPFAVKTDQDGESGSQSQTDTDTKPESTVTDPRDPTSTLTEDLSSKSTHLTTQQSPTPTDQTRARRLKKGEQKYIETRNQYISAIRGKRHMFIRRIMVLPEYQGMGIGKKLMRVVTDEADQLGICCWLFARPMGVRLYEGCGFRTLGVTEMDEVEEGFWCAETRAMMRERGG